MNSTPLSNYLRMLRENNKLRQNDLANLFGISRSAYSHYETAQTVPTTDSLRIIADYYKVSLEKLVRLSGGDFNSQAQNPCKGKRNAKEIYVDFLKECSDMVAEDLFNWMSIKDRELVFYYHNLTDSDKKNLMGLAKIMIINRKT